nr:regulator of G-protein signaling 11 isoform X4 [Paramormyrops kingsleyae]
MATFTPLRTPGRLSCGPTRRRIASRLHTSGALSSGQPPSWITILAMFLFCCPKAIYLTKKNIRKQGQLIDYEKLQHVAQTDQPHLGLCGDAGEGTAQGSQTEAQGGPHRAGMSGAGLLARQQTAKQNADYYKGEIEHIRKSLGRSRVKSSICLESFVKFSEQYLNHDPMMQGCPPSNPWITDDTALWTLNADMVETPTKLRVERWGFGFTELLRDPLGRCKFREYLEKEFSVENLCFWEACENIRHGESATIPQKVDEVYKQFLAPGASKWINVDSKTMEKTLQGMKSPHRFVLDDAQMHIYFLMKKDSYARYLKSDLYKNMLARAIEPQETKKSVFPFVRRQRHSSRNPALFTQALEDNSKTKSLGSLASPTAACSS